MLPEIVLYLQSGWEERVAEASRQVFRARRQGNE
jgi:hypothetical protein